MIVTFFSDYLNHHQTPFCEEMRKRLGDEFHFVATERVSESRLKLGYKNLEYTEYVVRSYASDHDYNEAMRLGYESDVVIIGSAPDEFIEKRLADNKLTFRYSERYFKKFRWRFHPLALRAHYERDFRYRNKNLYMLCASAYTAPDCRFIFSYPNKIYKWGYFPKVKTYDDIEKLIGWKHPASILWAGRLIGWKHPEEAIYMAEKLKSDGCHFTLDFIGDGELRPSLEQMIEKKGLSDCVHILGYMSPDVVREHMEKSEIFLFTSDKQEGWGAVLNESLNSACAVVACREIGSVPYLIDDGVNGFVCDKRGKNTLYSHVKQLIENESLRKKIQRNAYDTMKNVWNAETATDRFLHLIDCIQKGKETGYTSGPCSRD